MVDSNTVASQVVWIGQISGASLDLSHSDLVRYRCYKYKRKSVGAHPVHLKGLVGRRVHVL